MHVQAQNNKKWEYASNHGTLVLMAWKVVHIFVMDIIDECLYMESCVVLIHRQPKDNVEDAIYNGSLWKQNNVLAPWGVSITSLVIWRPLHNVGRKKSNARSMFFVANTTMQNAYARLIGHQQANEECMLSLTWSTFQRESWGVDIDIYALKI